MRNFLFVFAYWRLSRQGHCDAPGGMEYQRVLNEWRMARKPWRVFRFIKYHANVGVKP